MIKQLITTIPLTLIFLNVFTQNIDFEWGNSTGGDAFDQSNSILSDNMGNVIVLGSVSDSVDLDPGSDTIQFYSSHVSLIVQKLNVLGDLIWARSIGGSGATSGTSMVIDDVGDILITGTYNGTVDFDPGISVFNSTSNGSNNFFILKLTKDGEFSWVKSLGTSVNVGFTSSITIDSVMNIYFTGHFYDSLDCDPGSGVFNIYSSGDEDVFVEKLDQNGNFLWAKSFGGKLTDIGNDVKIGNSGNVYVATCFSDTADFDPTLGISTQISKGSFDCGLLKLNSMGNLIWIKTFGGIGWDQCPSIVLDESENVFSTGRFSDTVDFDPGTGVYDLISEGSDIYVLKLDSSGNFIWVKNMGGDGSNLGQSISRSDSGDLCISGAFMDTIDFNPGLGVFNLISKGAQDAFVLLLDSNGVFNWVKSIGGSGGQVGWFNSIGKSGNIYLTGTHRDTTDLDPGLGAFMIESNGFQDIFNVKLSPCPPVQSFDIITSCDSLTWINGSTYHFNNNTAMYNIVGGASNGCDSLIRLDLTFPVIDTSILSTNGTFSAVSSNPQFQWLDCGDNFSQISGETGQMFTPNINGSFAVEITQTGCIDTSSCVTITNVDIFGHEFIFSDINIYPNPTADKLIIEKSNTEYSFFIYNSVGKVLYEEKDILETTHSIDISKYRSGLLLIQVIKNNQSYFQKIVKI